MFRRETYSTGNLLPCASVTTSSAEAEVGEGGKGVGGYVSSSVSGGAFVASSAEAGVVDWVEVSVASVI